jgi:hypothetical protein
MFENKHEPLASRKVFLTRLMRTWLFGTGAVLFCLSIGIIGYHYVGHLVWIDAIHNASMILSGMGPVANIDNVSGKLFSSGYALFSGVAFISSIGIFLSPVVHRFLHKLNIEKKEQ